MVLIQIGIAMDKVIPTVNVSPEFCATLVNMCLHVGGDLTEFQYLVDACYGLIGLNPPNLWDLSAKRLSNEDKGGECNPIGKEHNGK